MPDTLERHHTAPKAQLIAQCLPFRKGRCSRLWCEGSTSAPADLNDGAIARDGACADVTHSHFEQLICPLHDMSVTHPDVDDVRRAEERGLLQQVVLFTFLVPLAALQSLPAAGHPCVGAVHGHPDLRALVIGGPPGVLLLVD